MTEVENDVVRVVGETVPKLKELSVSLAKAKDAERAFAEQCHYNALKTKVWSAIRDLESASRRVEAHNKAKEV